MMSQYPFRREEELKDVGCYQAFPMPYGEAGIPVRKFNTPITPKENFLRICRGEMPLWVPNYYVDFNFIQPLVMPDAVARWQGGKDWFGIEWQYEPLTNASMVKPGTRRLSDITNWEKELEIPDLSALDWERDFEENYKGKLSPDRPTVAVLVNGLFERTADLTSFEDAFCYLLEEPEALQSFYARLADWYVELLGILRRVYGVDMITFHDDMGTQRSPFFSTEIFRELLLPHYKKINDAAHSMGMYMNFHSCGCIEQHLDAIIEAGFDFWEGQDNSNDKKRTMERYGDRLAQASNIVPVGMSEDEMVAEIRRLIHELGPKGRFLIWLNTTQEPLFSVGSEAIYTISRELYSGLA